jgi:hypothetical protein
MRTPTAFILVVCVAAALASAGANAATEPQRDMGQRAWLLLQERASAAPSLEIRAFSVTGQRPGGIFCQTPAAPTAAPPGDAPADLAHVAEQVGGQSAKLLVHQFAYPDADGVTRLDGGLGTGGKPVSVSVSFKPAAGATKDETEVTIQARRLAYVTGKPSVFRVKDGQTVYATTQPQKRRQECIVVAATPLDDDQAQARRAEATVQVQEFLSTATGQGAEPKIVRDGWRPGHYAPPDPVEVVYLLIIGPAGRTVWTQVVAATPHAERSFIEAALYEEHTRWYSPSKRDGRAVAARGVQAILLAPGRWIKGAPTGGTAAPLTPGVPRVPR